MLRLPSLVAALAAIVLGGTLLTAPVTAAPAADSSKSTTARGGGPEREFRCHGHEATIVGTRRQNRIAGTRHRDVIVGRGGADVIVGRGGRDLICGGRGPDILDGGRGLDRLYGGRSRDQCLGERREHVNHHGCEVHLPSFHPTNPPSQNPRQMAGSSAAPAKVSSVAREPGGGSWFDWDRPLCTNQAIYLNKVYAKGDYTPQGWVAARAIGYQWDPYQGGWSNRTFGNWEVFSAPSGGGWYSHHMGGYAQNRGANTRWGYIVYWWNGAEWVDMSVYPIILYGNDAFFGAGPTPLPLQICST